ncbi:MAG: hypothetical protein K2Y32_11895 [Candidatus Obscuribacterales bacterium]|nr:hypothetical protein [Candidatus Obscuribacterales bacterium]
MQEENMKEVRAQKSQWQLQTAATAHRQDSTPCLHCLETLFKAEAERDHSADWAKASKEWFFYFLDFLAYLAICLGTGFISLVTGILFFLENLFLGFELDRQIYEKQQAELKGDGMTLKQRCVEENNYRALLRERQRLLGAIAEMDDILGKYPGHKNSEILAHAEVLLDDLHSQVREIEYKLLSQERKLNCHKHF